MKLKQEHMTKLSIMAFILGWFYTVGAIFIGYIVSPTLSIAVFATGIYFMIQRNYMLLTGR